jgi:hypothetical protein
MTAIEWLYSKMYENKGRISIEIFEKAKEMEKKEKLKHQLFIGKVSDVIGFEKTVELLKEVKQDIKYL